MLLALLGSLAVAGPRIATPHADALLAHAGDPHVVVPAPPPGAAPPPSEPVPDMTVYAYHPYWESRDIRDYLVDRYSERRERDAKAEAKRVAEEAKPAVEERLAKM